MAIHAYVGLPGSGKSYGVIENVILPALTKGRHVFTNIPLNMDALGADYDIELVHVLDNEQLNKGDEHFWLGFPGGAVLVFDEVWRFWPAGMKVHELKPYHKEFFAEHRHKVGVNELTQEIIIITQDLSQISAYVRTLIDTTYLSVKLSALSAKTKYRINVYTGGQKGPNYPKNVVSSFLGTYKPSVYRYYKSHTKSETGMAGMERIVDNRGVIWKHPVVRFGLPFAIVLFVAAAFELHRVKESFVPATTPNKETVRPHVESVAPSVNLSIQKPEVSHVEPVASVVRVVDSHIWRLVGSYSVFTGRDSVIRYVIHNAYGGSRYLESDFCKVVDGDIRCEYGGEYISRFTGRVIQSYDKLPAGAVNTAVNTVTK
jgi:zona occludens toxin